MNESTKHDAIYLQVCDDDEDPWCGEVTWCQDRIHDEDVKYIRADLVEARIRKAVEAEGAAKQAEIDMLMMEYCPDEMTRGQIDEWARNQNTVDGSNKRLCGERK